jgi:hypothetical protein
VKKPATFTMTYNDIVRVTCPKTKIKELGLSRAKLWWAKHDLPYKEFKKAENQHKWVEHVKKWSEIPQPMEKIIELGLSQAKLWWANNNLPYKQFKKAEAQYNWEQKITKTENIAIKIILTNNKHLKQNVFQRDK